MSVHTWNVKTMKHHHFAKIIRRRKTSKAKNLGASNPGNKRSSKANNLVASNQEKKKSSKAKNLVASNQERAREV